MRRSEQRRLAELWRRQQGELAAAAAAAGAAAAAAAHGVRPRPEMPPLQQGHNAPARGGGGTPAAQAYWWQVAQELQAIRLPSPGATGAGLCSSPCVLLRAASSPTPRSSEGGSGTVGGSAGAEGDELAMAGVHAVIVLRPISTPPPTARGADSTAALPPSPCAAVLPPPPGSKPHGRSGAAAAAAAAGLPAACRRPPQDRENPCSSAPGSHLQPGGAWWQPQADYGAPSMHQPGTPGIQEAGAAAARASAHPRTAGML